MTYKVLLALAPIALVAACKAQVGAGDSAAALDAIHKAEAAQMAAFKAHDLDAATGFYTDDAQFVGPGSPVQSGKDAIRASIESLMKDPAASLEFSADNGWVAASGDLAVTAGHFKLTTTAEDGKPATTEGAYQTVWKKTDKGWQIASDFNTQVPSADMAAAHAASAVGDTPESAPAT
jgi:uncharacterized protein (TIGR02246 family)